MREEERKIRDALKLEFDGLTLIAKKELILAASEYRSGPGDIGTVYMGSLAMGGLIGVLGGKYGKDSLHDLLVTATPAQLDLAFERIWPYWHSMKTRPMKRCEHCGSQL